MKKINIAELLKDCPSGMELDCSMYENVIFDCIRQSPESKYPIHCLTKTNGVYNRLVFTQYGCSDRHPNAKCVIFPKGKTTWEGFHRPFKDGDIVTYKDENKLVSMILNKFVNFVEVHYHCALYDNAKGFVTNNYIVGELKYTHLATEEEKQKLFDVIKENGYKWNAETRTLERLVEPKFKVGNRIKYRGGEIVHRIVQITEDSYILDNLCSIPISIEHMYNLVPNKFDITTLKPFDKVLVRQSDNGKWGIDFFGSYTEGFYYATSSCMYIQCIPYKGNEHLLGTTDDCNEYFKTWE